MVRFPILIYHALWPPLDCEADRQAYFAADVQLRDPGARLYALDQQLFLMQMQLIADTGWHTPSQWSELDFPSSPTEEAGSPRDSENQSRRLWITFDDGHRSNCELALPVLRQCDLKAIFFITTDWIGQPSFMSPDQIRQLRRAGMLIGAHSCSHRYLSDLAPDELWRELADSKARLEEILQEPVIAMALPGGRNQPALRQLARQAGYRHLFTSTIGMATPDGDPLDWPRVPITNRQPSDFIERLVHGDLSLVDAMARSARLRQTAKRLLGNTLYDRLRGLMLKK